MMQSQGNGNFKELMFKQQQSLQNEMNSLWNDSVTQV